MSALALLYRGPLDSCNYGCSYCPFAKRATSSLTLARDQSALERFVSWVGQASRWELSLLFTPYGEAMIWPHYQDALVELSRMPHVRQVSIQTNASGKLDFLEAVDHTRLSLWISWHPTEIALEPFAARISALHRAGVRLSVGAVAAPPHLEQVESLRRALPPDLPMWINAQKPGPGYAEAERARWRAIDPEFDVDAQRHLTRGQACLAGEDTLSVAGDGTLTRCHFVEQVLGNLYRDDLGALLQPRPCSRGRCDCWIGYVNLVRLDLRQGLEGDRRLARIRR